MLSVVMLCIVIQFVVMLNVVLPSVTVLRAVAQVLFIEQTCQCKKIYPHLILCFQPQSHQKHRMRGSVTYSQHFIFFVTYVWAQKARALGYTRLERLASDITLAYYDYS
jgi:hypothetical protein